MTKADGTVIGTPGVHHGVHIPEGSLPGKVWHEPVRWPGGVGALLENGIDFTREIDEMALGDLQHRTKAFNEVKTKHGGRHVDPSAVGAGETAAAEIFADGRRPGGGLEARAGFRRGDFPKGLHRRFAILELP